MAQTNSSRMSYVALRELSFTVPVFSDSLWIVSNRFFNSSKRCIMSCVISVRFDLMGITDRQIISKSVVINFTTKHHYFFEYTHALDSHCAWTAVLFCPVSRASFWIKLLQLYESMLFKWYIDFNQSSQRQEIQNANHICILIQLVMLFCKTKCVSSCQRRSHVILQFSDAHRMDLQGVQ
jgi:hypothetical protein